ncbi:hypothetical protein N2152v2_000377 [Parachlorella kessleri]
MEEERRPRQGRAADPAEEAYLANFIKVTASQEPRTYAAKLAWNARKNELMPMLATGPPAINTAVKAVAIARKLLEDDNLELYCQPAFRDRNMGNSLALYLTAKRKPLNPPGANEPSDLTVSRTSKPQVVAGAMAARAREGVSPRITGIGPEAVCNAMVAACHARLYLENDRLDLKCLPSFEEVTKEGDNQETRTMTAVRIQLVVEEDNGTSSLEPPTAGDQPAAAAAPPPGDTGSDSSQDSSRAWATSIPQKVQWVQGMQFVLDPVTSGTLSPALVTQVLFGPSGPLAPLGVIPSNGVNVHMYPPTAPNATSLGDTLMLRYKVAFPAGFPWGPNGGRLPGVGGGGEVCDAISAGVTCWSLQLAWRSDGTGEVLAYIPAQQQAASFWKIPPLTGARSDGSVSIGGGSFQLKPDYWNDVQILLQLNSVGQADGVLQVYVNGAKVVESAGILYRLHPDLSVNSFIMEMAYWSAMPAIVQQQYMVLKNVQLYTGSQAPPGPSPAPAPAPGSPSPSSRAPGPTPQGPSPTAASPAPAPQPPGSTAAPGPSPAVFASPPAEPALPPSPQPAARPPPPLRLASPPPQQEPAVAPPEQLPVAAPPPPNALQARPPPPASAPPTSPPPPVLLPDSPPLPHVVPGSPPPPFPLPASPPPPQAEQPSPDPIPEPEAPAEAPSPLPSPSPSVPNVPAPSPSVPSAPAPSPSVPSVPVPSPSVPIPNCQPSAAELEYAAKGLHLQFAKRGNGWSFEDCSQLQALYKSSVWWFTHTLTAPSEAAEYARQMGLEFVPMIRNRVGIQSLAGDIPAGPKYLLAFHNANHMSDANLSPEDAAAMWPQVVFAANISGLKLGSPSASTCSQDCVTTSPFDWWDRFFAACQGCKVDFMVTNVYSCDKEAAMAYIRQIRMYGKPIWVTEFTCPSTQGNVTLQADFLTAMLSELDADDWVQRYSWLGPLTADYSWIGPSASLLDPSKPSQVSTLGNYYNEFISPIAYERGVVTSASLNGSSTGAPSSNSTAGAAGEGSQQDDWKVTAASMARERPWDALCGECSQALSQGQALADFSSTLRTKCQEVCGFWDWQEPGAVKQWF